MVFEVSYPRQESRSYSVRFRESLPEVLDVLEDELLADRIFLFPERRYIRRPGGGLMRMWEHSTPPFH